MGEGDRHARFVLSSGPSRALGVAFGVNGSLAEAAATGPLDLSVELELNEWNGAVEPRVVLGSIYPTGSADSARAKGEPSGGAISADEFWRRHDAELSAALGPWPPQFALPAGTRERVERPGRRRRRRSPRWRRAAAGARPVRRRDPAP